MTPESSEAPRESLVGIPVEDREAFIAGNASVLLKDSALYQSTKTSSPELASLATRYATMSDNELWIAITGKRELRYDQDEGPAICADIRRLAAAVLNQEPAK